MYNTKLEEKKIGDWSNVVDLVDFAIVKHAPKSLLGTAMADVLLKYKRKSNQKLEDVKSLHLYGPEEIVYKRALEIIDRKKNKMHSSQLRQRFIHEFQTSKFRSNAENFGEPGTLLGRAIYDTGASTRAFAEKYKIKAATLYHHVRGGPNGREVSRDVAIEYAKKLNCDPVDLMFEKKSVPVWSKCNLLKATDLEDKYSPGRLFSYATDENLERVVVPRDIFRTDIKAIKVEAKGSMYNNKIAFYYRGAQKEQNILNQLCIVGINVEASFFEDDDYEVHYYFGLYEENQGESNLLNPDPFAKEKYILKNFEPTFVSPIILVLNPEVVVDQTNLKNKIPDEALVRREEMLLAELARVKSQLNHKEKINNLKDKYSEDLGDKLKKTKEEATKIKNEAKELSEKLLAEQAKLQNDMKKISDFIQKEMYQEKEKYLFQGLGEAVRKKTAAKLKIVGGKKN